MSYVDFSADRAGDAGWEPPGRTIHLAPRVGLCIYNVGATIVFVIVGTSGGMNGILLWPAAILLAVKGAIMLWVVLAAPHSEQPLILGEKQ